MPISGWIMFGWFWLVILTGIGLVIWGWRAGQLEGQERAKYVALEERDLGARSGRDESAGRDGSRPC